MEDSLSVQLIVNSKQQICSGNQQIGTLRTLQIAFTPISSLQNLQYCHQLQELSLIQTGNLQSMAGLQKLSHSLQVLRIFHCQLLQIDPIFSSLQRLRELNLSNNRIVRIQNIQSCPLLSKLSLFSNQIRKIENLQGFSHLKLLWLQDNRIQKVQNLDTLINLQELDLTGNPISNFSDLQGLTELPIINTLGFGSLDFPPCPVTQIEGYKNFILSSVSSSFFQVLDGEVISGETKETARREYITQSLRLQEKLQGIQNQHRQILINLQTKNKQNQQQLKYIQRMLVDDLHSLRTEIQQGKSKLIKQHNRLKALRNKSEETLKQDLQVIQNKYTKELERIYKQQHEELSVQTQKYEQTVKALEFEQRIALGLIDLLYSTEGRVVYTQLGKASQEYRFVEALTQHKQVSSHVHIRKIYQIAEPSQREPSKIQYLFMNIPVDQFKPILLKQEIQDSLEVHTSFIEAILDTPGFYIIGIIRLLEMSEISPDQDYIQIQTDSLASVIFDYILIVQVSKYKQTGDFRTMLDQRILSFLSEPVDLPIGSFSQLKSLEKQAMEKYNQHLKRVWGQIDPSTVDSLQQQEEQIKVLMGTMDNLRTQIQNQRQTQAQLLQEMRINLKEQTVPPLQFHEYRKGK